MQIRTLYTVWLLAVMHLLSAQTPELGLPVGHTQAVTSVAYSPDGRWVLTGSLDKLAKIWDLEGRVLRTLNAGTGAVTGVGFSPKGTYVYTQSKDSTVVWTLDGRVFLRCNDAPVFSPDETKLLYTSGDTSYWHHLKTGRRQPFAIEKRAKNWFSSKIPSINRFSPDGRFFLHWTNTALELWTAADNRAWSIQLPEMIAAAEFSPDQACILVAFADGTLSSYNLEGKIINSIGEASEMNTRFSCSAIVYDVSWVRLGFSNDNKKVFCSSTSAARVYDIAGAGSSKDWLRPDFSLPTEVAGDGDRDGRFGHILEISPDGFRVLWRDSRNERITVRNRQGEPLLSRQGLYGPSCGREIIADICYRPANAVFDPAGRAVLVGLDDGSAEMIGLDGGVIQRFQSGLAAKTTQVARLAEGSTLLLNLSEVGDSEEGAITFEEIVTLDLKNNRLKAFDPATADTSAGAYRRFSAQINAEEGRFVAYNGRYTLEGDEDPNIRYEDLLNPGLYASTSAGTVRVFEHGKTAFQFWDEEEGGIGSVSDVCLSPDEKYLLTSPTEGPPRVWDFQCLRDPSNPASAYLSDDNFYLTPDAIQKCFVRTLERAPARSYFFDFAQDSRSLLVKENEVIHWVGLEGDILQTFRGHRLNVTGATFLQNDRFVLSWSEDYTTRLWDAATGEERATIIFMPGHDWVITTPGGLFDASPGAMEMMYYIIGLEVLEIEQIKERYYEPGLLQKLLGYHDEPLRSVEQLDALELYPAVKLDLDTAQNTLRIRLVPRNGGVGKVSVFVNGKEIIEEANPLQGSGKIRDTSMTIPLGNYARYFLPDSLNDVSVRAYNAAGWLKSAPQRVTYRPVFARSKGTDQDRGAAPVRLEGAPNLFILSVGTSNYAGTKLDLKFAGKDAVDMANAFQQIGRQLFNDTPGKVASYVFTTDSSAYPAPTKSNIQQAFEAIKMEAKAADILFVYFSGHGIAKGNEFYYLTQEMSSFEVEIEGKSKVISNTELTRWINDIPALKQVLILDACNSGKVVESLAMLSRGLNSSQIRALERLKDRTGMFILTGSAADKVSYEAGQFGQGLLTYSILEGIKGEVPDKFGHVDVMNLFRYATERVPELAKGIGGIQTPVPVGPLGKSFPIGIADSTVSIPIAQEKSVFIRNIFMNEERFDDGLELTKSLNDYLLEQTASGEAGFIFVDVSEYENAYSIRGLYRLSGNGVTVRGRLYKGKTPVGEEFKVLGKRSDLPALVEAIVEKVSGMLD